MSQLRKDWKPVTAVVVTTLVMTVEHYRRFDGLFRHESVERAFFYLVVPLLVIWIVFRDSPVRYGFRIGDWRRGLILTAAACGGLAVVVWYVAHTPAFRGYYAPRAESAGLPLALDVALNLVGWEFLFRGFLLFALYPVCGPLAIVLQAVPFTIAHFGKPELETLSCIFGGSALGYVAWRTRSFLYPFLIHWFLTTFTLLVASGALG